MMFLIEGNMDEFYEIILHYNDGEFPHSQNLFEEVAENFYLGIYNELYDAYVISEEDFDKLIEDLEDECNTFNKGIYSEILGLQNRYCEDFYTVTVKSC